MFPRVLLRQYSTYYTPDHTWIKITKTKEHGQFGLTRTGIMKMQDLVHVSTQNPDQIELETFDKVFSIQPPLPGTVIEINNNLFTNTDLILEDPEGKGWLGQLNPTVSIDYIKKYLMNKRQYEKYIKQK